MKMGALVLAASLLLVGCGDGTPPSAYKHPRDQFFAAVPLPFINDEFGPCLRTTDGELRRLPDAECYRLSEPQRLRGVAVTGFETGSFYPGRTTVPHEHDRSDIWIELDRRILPDHLRNGCRRDCAVYLDFVGRRTAVPGSYGHFGVSKHQVIIDRLLHATMACQVEVGTKRLFVGTPECHGQLPKRRMSGVWVLGHEYSVFYEGEDDAPELPSRGYSETWLEVDPSKVLQPYGIEFDGETHAYRVNFIGTSSDAPGIYGHWGAYSRGALVLNMIELKEIPLGRSGALNS